MKQDFQTIVQKLSQFWQENGCAYICGLDQPVGAGTFHPATFLRALGSNPWRSAFVQPSRRPTDGRYGNNPNRVQMHHQFQVVLKPAPIDIQDLYLESLKAIGVDCKTNDIRFVEDNWESPTLGAWGLGWEVWLNGMEISQFTYFQQVGGISCEVVSGELTYGLERLIMNIQEIDNIYDIVWSDSPAGKITYGDIFLENEKQMSQYNFEQAPISELSKNFEQCMQQVEALLNIPLAAYEQVLQASHIFNLLDARKAITVTERQRTILKIREKSQAVAKAYLKLVESYEE